MTKRTNGKDGLRLWLFLIGALVVGGLYLLWGQYNTASTLYDVGFLRFRAAERLAEDEGYALTAAEQAAYDTALGDGRRWAEETAKTEGSFETVSAAAAYGEAARLTLPYALYDQGADKTVILLHGYCGGDEALLWAPWWWEAGYNVLLPTQRGYAGAAEENNAPTTFGVYERCDLHDLILAAGLETETVLIHGRGAGAAAALLLAADSALRDAGVDGLVLESLYQNLGALQRTQLQRQFHMGDVFAGQFLRRRAADLLGFQLDQVDLAAEAAEGEIPALFVCGEADRFLGPEDTAAVYQAWGGNKALARLDSGSYRALWTADGANYRSNLSAFLAKLPVT